MPRPYNDFKNKWYWRRVDFDWKFWYQCIDLFKQYYKEIFGIVLAKVGNANELRSNKYNTFGKWWTRIVGTKDLMQWDIVFSTVWKYWHVGIFDRRVDGDRPVKVLDQNWSWINPAVDWTNGDEIQVHWYAPWFIAGVWRNNRIKQNRKLEMKYIKDKIDTQWYLDIITEEYAKSTLHKI